MHLQMVSAAAAHLDRGEDGRVQSGLVCFPLRFAVAHSFPLSPLVRGGRPRAVGIGAKVVLPKGATYVVVQGSGCGQRLVM